MLPTLALSPKQEEPSIPEPAPVVTDTPAMKPYPALKADPEQAEKYKNELRAISKAKGLSEGKMREIEGVIGGDGVNKLCPNGESGWHPDAVGDKGTSFGLVQIHLPAHPHITKEQALNPTFALNFIVDEFLLGHERKWTCWRVMYKQSTPPLPHSAD